MAAIWLLVAGAWMLALCLGRRTLPLPAVAHLVTWSSDRPAIDVVGGILRLGLLVGGGYLLVGVSVGLVVTVGAPSGRRRARSRRLLWPVAHLMAVGAAVASAAGAVSTVPAAAAATTQLPVPAGPASAAAPRMWRVSTTPSPAGRPVPRRQIETGRPVRRRRAEVLRRSPRRPIVVRAVPAASSVWVVAAGDSLWSIAVQHLGPSATNPQVAAYWERMIRANPQLVDPNLVFPGDRLHLPPRP